MLFIRLFTPAVLFSVTEDKMPCYIGEYCCRKRDSIVNCFLLFLITEFGFSSNYTFFDHLMINLQQSNMSKLMSSAKKSKNVNMQCIENTF